MKEGGDSRRSAASDDLSGAAKAACSAAQSAAHLLMDKAAFFQSYQVQVPTILMREVAAAKEAEAAAKLKLEQCEEERRASQRLSYHSVVASAQIAKRTLAQTGDRRTDTERQSEAGGKDMQPQGSQQATNAPLKPRTDDDAAEVRRSLKAKADEHAAAARRAAKAKAAAGAAAAQLRRALQVQEQVRPTSTCSLATHFPIQI